MCLLYSNVTATLRQHAQQQKILNPNNADPFFIHLEAAEEDRLLLIPRRETHWRLTGNICLLWLRMLLVRAVGVKRRSGPQRNEEQKRERCSLWVCHRKWRRAPKALSLYPLFIKVLMSAALKSSSQPKHAPPAEYLSFSSDGWWTCRLIPHSLLKARIFSELSQSLIGRDGPTSRICDIIGWFEANPGPIFSASAYTDSGGDIHFHVLELTRVNWGILFR